MRIYDKRRHTSHEVDYGTADMTARHDGIMLQLDRFSVKLDILEVRQIVELWRERREGNYVR